MKLSKKFTTVTPLSKFLAMALFIILPFISLYLGIKYQELKFIINSESINNATKEVYPECIAGLCPKFIQIDAIPTNNSPETAIIIPLAMTQGYGRLVIVEEGGKKHFDSGGLPGIGVKSVSDGNGFILQYSSPMDENLSRKNYEVKYIWENGKFVAEDNTKNWKTYTNPRFNYSISYPSDWKEGEVATNGDGRAIYKDNLNEILVYGSLSPFTFSTQGAPAERSVFVLNDGRKATSLKEIKNGKVIYIIFFNQKGQDELDVQYVLNANVTEKFFTENEDILNRIGKSFKLAERP